MFMENKNPKLSKQWLWKENNSFSMYFPNFSFESSVHENVPLIQLLFFQPNYTAFIFCLI